jgi:hypothetical protein
LTVTPLSAHVPATGGTVIVTVTVTQGSGCQWTALPVGLFLTVSGTANRSGNDTVVLNVAANTGPARSGTATVAGQTVTITQDAVAPTTCVFAVSPLRVDLPVGGGKVEFDVTVTQGTACVWTTTIAGAGLTIASGTSGTGNGKVVVEVAANPGVERWSGIIIAGHLAVIHQPEAPGACSYAVNPRTFEISSAQQTVEFDVTIIGSRDHCGWSLSTPNPAVLRMVSMTPSGNTTRVVLEMSANTGFVDRTGSAVAAGILVTVKQAGSIPAGPCRFTVTPATIAVPANGGTVSVTVALAQGSVSACSWSIVPNAAFVAVSSHVPVPQTGGAIVGLTVGANAGAARSGTLTIAGTVVTINQAAAGT